MSRCCQRLPQRSTKLMKTRSLWTENTFWRLHITQCKDASDREWWVWSKTTGWSWSSVSEVRRWAVRTPTHSAVTQSLHLFLASCSKLFWVFGVNKERLQNNLAQSDWALLYSPRTVTVRKLAHTETQTNRVHCSYICHTEGAQLCSHEGNSDSVPPAS